METTRPFATLEHEEQWDRLGRAARAALPTWGLEGARARPLNYGENATFAVEAAAGRFMLRLARPRYHTAAELRSECAWLRSLCADGFAVPEPVAHDDGYLVVVEVEGVPARCAMLFRWVEGEILGERTPQRIRKLGEVMAELHAHARGWTPPAWFVRPTWSGATMLTEEDSQWGTWRTVPGLTPAQRDLFARTTEVLLPRLEALDRSERLLVHADLHQHNVVYAQSRPCLIDFDDCGWGTPAFDAAVPLRGSWEEGADLVWEAFTAGYAEVAGPLPFVRAHTDAYRIARELDVLAWVHDRARDVTHLRERAAGWADQLEAPIRTWLAGET